MVFIEIGEIIKIIPRVQLFISESGSLRYELLRKLSMGKKPRKLLNRTNSKYFNHTARRVNRIMNAKKFSYLEIGVASGTTLQSVIADKKHGVDPLPLFNIKQLPKGVTFSKMTSDGYFSSLDRNVPCEKLVSLVNLPFDCLFSPNWFKKLPETVRLEPEDDLLYL